MSHRTLTTVLMTAAVTLLALAPSAQAAEPLEGFKVKVGTKRAPVVAQAKAPGIGAVVKFRVNGKRVKPEDVYASGAKGRYVELSARNGLKVGKNKIEARRNTGKRSFKSSVRFKLGRADLLADAGPDTSMIAAAPGVTIGSNAQGGGKGIDYNWKVVDGPAGAKLTLKGADGARPTLASTTPGVYRVRVTAQKNKPDAIASHDQVAVTVDKNTPPIGAPLNTIGANGAIEVGPDSFGSGGAIAWVVLSRSAGTMVESGTATRDDAGMKTLVDTAEKYRDRQKTQRHIMIVSGRTGIPEGQLKAFGDFLQKVGANVPTADNIQALKASKPFSVIGVPGGARGAATTRYAPSAGTGTSGNIAGYLQKNQATDADGGAIYDVVTPEHITYDTKFASSGTSNTMRIGTTNYVQSLGTGETAGFHLVALNGLTGAKFWEAKLVTNGTDATQDRTKQAAVATELTNVLNTAGANPVVLVQTIGKPKAAGPEWERIANQLRRLGANVNYIYGLDGSTTYSIVGSVDSTAPPQESSDAYDKGPYADPGYPTARLRGVISRGRDSRLVPTTSGTPTPQSATGAINTDLVDITWQAPTAFPQLAPGATPEQRAAITQWFCSEKMGFCKTADSCNEIRACYWQQWGLPASTWSSIRAAVASAENPTTGGFDPAQFTSVKDQLSKELGWLVVLKGYSESLQKPFEKVQGRAQVDLQSISDNIYDGLQRPQGINKTAYALELIGKAIKAGAIVPPPIGGIFSGIGAMFDTAAYLSKDRSGPAVLGEQVKKEAAKLGQEMAQRFDTASQQIDNTALMLVSDYGKLGTAADKILNDPYWKLGNDTTATQQLELGSKQWFYTALVPTAYPYLIRGFGQSNARDMDCIITDDKRAWPNQPDDAQMLWPVGYDNNGNPQRWIFFFTRGMGGAMSPPGGLGTKMFAPRIASSGPTGLGMEKLEFFTPRVFNGSIAHAINGDRGSRCRVGWLPQQW